MIQVIRKLKVHTMYQIKQLRSQLCSLHMKSRQQNHHKLHMYSQKNHHNFHAHPLLTNFPFHLLTDLPFKHMWTKIIKKACNTSYSDVWNFFQNKSPGKTQFSCLINGLKGIFNIIHFSRQYQFHVHDPDLAIHRHGSIASLFFQWRQICSLLYKNLPYICLVSKVSTAMTVHKLQNCRRHQTFSRIVALQAQEGF